MLLYISSIFQSECEKLHSILCQRLTERNLFLFDEIDGDVIIWIYLCVIQRILNVSFSCINSATNGISSVMYDCLKFLDTISLMPLENRICSYAFHQTSKCYYVKNYCVMSRMIFYHKRAVI